MEVGEDGAAPDAADMDIERRVLYMSRSLSLDSRLVIWAAALSEKRAHMFFVPNEVRSKTGRLAGHHQLIAHGVVHAWPPHAVPSTATQVSLQMQGAVVMHQVCNLTRAQCVMTCICGRLRAALNSPADRGGLMRTGLTPSSNATGAPCDMLMCCLWP